MIVRTRSKINKVTTRHQGTHYILSGIDQSNCDLSLRKLRQNKIKKEFLNLYKQFASRISAVVGNIVSIIISDKTTNSKPEGSTNTTRRNNSMNNCRKQKTSIRKNHTVRIKLTVFFNYFL